MQPNTTPNDGMWISKEEYQRLQAQQGAPVTAAAPANTVHSGAVTSQSFASPTKAQTGLQIFVGLIIAGGFYLSLTVVNSTPLTMACLFLLVCFSVMSMRDVLVSRREGKVVTSKRVYKSLLIAACVVAAAPVIIAGGFVVLLLIILASGGGKGS